MKRIIALVLSLVMALSLCVPAWAEWNPNKPLEGMPEATVENSTEYENIDLPWGSYGSWSPTEGLDSHLEAAYTFSCTETLEQAKKNPYANWYCDFVVVLDKALDANQLFLGGNYGSFGWVGFHNGDLKLEANTEVPLLGSVTGNGWTYLDVVQFVGTFICGVGDVDNALDGATFTVMLRLTNPENKAEFYNVATVDYTFDDVDRANVTDSEGLTAAIKDGATEIQLADGTYALPSIGEKTITIEGVGDETVLDFTKAYNVNGASITFKNLKVQGVNANVNSGFGIQGTTGHIAYENCTFVNAVTNEYYGTVSYKDCLFTGTFYITTYAVDSATFENCVFDRTDSRAVLVFSHGDNPLQVTLTNCEFKADAQGKTGAGDWTAAVEVDTTNIKTAGTTVTITDCTYDENYSGIVRDKSPANATPATITVNYTYSFSANGGTGTMDSKVVAAGTEITLPANGFTAPSGKQFKGWATSENGAVIIEKTYTVSAPTTFYAIWESIPVYYPPVVDTPTETPEEKPVETPAETPVTPAQPTTPSTEVTVPVGGNENTVKVEATVTGTTATIDKIDTTELNTVIGSEVDTGKVTIDFSTVTGTTETTEGSETVEAAPVDTVEIPAAVIEQIAEAVADPENNAESLEVVLGDGASIEFDAEALAEKVAQAGGDDITISIKPTTAVAENLSEAILFTVGESVAFDITVTSGGVAISDMGGNITITAPYELSEGETAEGIVVYYVDNEGNREKCETTYDAATGRVSWVTNHLSVYMVSYEAPADDGAADDGAVAETPADDAQSSGSPVLWIVIAVVVVVAIVAAVIVSKKRKA